MRRQLAHAYLKEPPEPEIEVIAPRTATTSSEELEIEGSNPFNPGTVIAFNLPTAAEVHLVIYNTLGQAVRTLVDHDQMLAGHQRILWNGMGDEGRTLASGVYVIRLAAGKQNVARKLTLLK